MNERKEKKRLKAGHLYHTIDHIAATIMNGMNPRCESNFGL